MSDVQIEVVTSGSNYLHEINGDILSPSSVASHETPRSERPGTQVSSAPPQPVAVRPVQGLERTCETVTCDTVTRAHGGVRSQPAASAGTGRSAARAFAEDPKSVRAAPRVPSGGRANREECFRTVRGCRRLTSVLGRQVTDVLPSVHMSAGYRQGRGDPGVGRRRPQAQPCVGGNGAL